MLEEEEEDSEGDDGDEENERRRRTGTDRVDMAIQTTFMESPSPPSSSSATRFRGQKVSPPSPSASPYFLSSHLRSATGCRDTDPTFHVDLNPDFLNC